MGRKTDDDLPDILYNYSSLENKDIKQDILDNISNSRLFFSNPLKAFNDPFDCRLELDWSGTVEQWARIFKGVLNKHDKSKLNNEQLHDLARKHIEDMKDPDKRMTFLETDVMPTVGMFCLSGLKDDILMFSYYSASHKGFSLGFDIKNYISELTSNYVLSFSSINYIDKLDLPNYLKTPLKKLFDYNLFTKSTKWERENEWRITNINRWGNHDYPEKMLKEIVLGCQITKENRENIIEANARRKYPAKIFDTKKLLDEFGFKRIEIK